MIYAKGKIMNLRIGITNFGVFSQYIELLQDELPEQVALVVINDVFTDLEQVIKNAACRSGSKAFF